MDRPCALARTQHTRSYCVRAGRPAFPPDTTWLWASRRPWRPRSRAGGDASPPRSAFQRISSLHHQSISAQISATLGCDHPSPFLRTFPDPPTRLNSQPPRDTPIVFPQITSPTPGLHPNQSQTPLLVHTPSRSHRASPLRRSFRILNLPLEPPRNDHIRDF